MASPSRECWLASLALAAGLGPTITTNTIYHRTILLVLVVGLALLQTQALKGAGAALTPTSNALPSQRPP